MFGYPRRFGEAIVLVDVFRSSTTIVEALGNGAKYVLPSNSIEDAKRLKDKVREEGHQVLLVGERLGFTPKGFDLNISPQAMKPEVVSGKVIVYTSTNLTRILKRCMSAKTIIIGCLTNAAAVAKYLRAKNITDLIIVACGVRDTVTLEDVVGAGAIVYHLYGGNLSDTALLSYLVYKNPSWRQLIYDGFVAKHLHRIGFSDDLYHCTRKNTSETVPVLHEGKIINHNLIDRSIRRSFGCYMSLFIMAC